MYPDAIVIRDAVPKRLVDAYAETIPSDPKSLPDSASVFMRKDYWSTWRAGTVARDSGIIAWPRASADACLVAAYVVAKCREVFLSQSWAGSRLTTMQREYPVRYPLQDFQFWVKYGSWSCCGSCGSYHFNDQYFREVVYQNTQNRSVPDLLSAARRTLPDDPVEHAPGVVGQSSRWWYLTGMFHPVADCGRCGKLPRKGIERMRRNPGRTFTEMLKKRKEQYEAAKAKSIAGTPGQEAVKTCELYRVPYVRPLVFARACLRIPRYYGGVFRLDAPSGDLILDLSPEEQKALQIVVLRTDVQEEKYGAAHHLNWKKVGLSRAYYVKGRLSAERMPTPRAVAAFAFLQKHNQYYKAFLRYHNKLLDGHLPLTMSSYDLFVQERGVECAMFPHMYPMTEFTDTGILTSYKAESEDTSNRVLSIGQSWTRKVMSGARAYAEHRDLAFFLYEKAMAQKFFAAQCRSQRMGVTADVMVRDSQQSSGYWDIVQDALADLVRIMVVRCLDEENHKELYDHVRGLRGQVWLCAFPNLFITIAPAEWTFPRPYFLEPYVGCVFAGSYLMALHMFYLVRCIWAFLSNRFGHRFFVVLEWVVKTEYQGRGTPHWFVSKQKCFETIRS